MNRVHYLTSKLTELNWENTLFRLWVVAAVFWELRVLVSLPDQDGMVETTWLMLLPIILLIAGVLSFQLSRWVLLGLNDRQNVTELCQRWVKSTALQVVRIISIFRHKLSRPIIATIFLILIISLAAYWSFEAKDTSSNGIKMAIYKVKAPDGQIIKVEWPAGSSETEVIAQAKWLYAKRTTASK